MKYKYFYITPLICAIVSSCGDHDFDVKDKLLTDYGKDYINTYGNPADSQTWNTAVQYGIEILSDISFPCDIYVYSADPFLEKDKAFLLGKYINVKESAKLSIDGPSTLNSIFIGIEQDGKNAIKKSIVKNKKAEVSFSIEDFSSSAMPEVLPMIYQVLFELGDEPGLYDFNDVVLNVTHVSGEDTADISLMAVGATKSMSVTYDGTMLFEDVLKAFSLYNLKHTVNVSPGQHKDNEPRTYTNLNVGEEFSICKDLENFIITEKDEKGVVATYKAWPYDSFYFGMPSHVIVVANPYWDWVSEKKDITDTYPSFAFWAKADGLYNDWWDYLWDKKDLILVNGSYQPTMNYEDCIVSAAEIQAIVNSQITIPYDKLSKFKKAREGVDLSFVLTDRNHQEVRITVSRNDSKSFQWYTGEATVKISSISTNVDYGGGNAEACHILLSNEDIATLIKNKASLSVTFDRGDSNAKLNSVWVREHK